MCLANVANHLKQDETEHSSVNPTTLASFQMGKLLLQHMSGSISAAFRGADRNTIGALEHAMHIHGAYPAPQ